MNAKRREAMNKSGRSKSMAELMGQGPAYKGKMSVPTGLGAQMDQGSPLNHPSKAQTKLIDLMRP